MDLTHRLSNQSQTWELRDAAGAGDIQDNFLGETTMNSAQKTAGQVAIDTDS